MLHAESGAEKSPGYKSNLKAGETADVVILIGPDHPNEQCMQRMYKQTLEDCQKKGLKFVILGDGVNPVKNEDIAKLPPAKHALVNGHGSVVRNDDDDMKHHHVNLGINAESTQSTKILSDIQKQTGAKKILFGSCFAGRINADIKENSNEQLLSGTELITTSTDTESALSGVTTKMAASYMNSIAANKGGEASLNAYFGEMLATIPDTISYAYQGDDALHAHTNRRGLINHHALTDSSITQWVDFSQKNYNAFLQKIGQNQIQPTIMNNSQINAYKEEAISIYVQHLDFTSMEKLLKTEKGNSPEIRKEAIHLLLNDYENITKNVNDMKVMGFLRLLLKDDGMQIMEDYCKTTAFSTDKKEKLIDIMTGLHTQYANSDDDPTENSKKISGLIDTIKMGTYISDFDDIKRLIKAADEQSPQTDNMSFNDASFSMDRLNSANRMLQELRNNSSHDNIPALTNEIQKLQDSIDEKKQHIVTQLEENLVTSKVDSALQLMDSSSRAYVDGNEEQANVMLQSAKSELEQASQELRKMKTIGVINADKYDNLQGKIDEEMMIIDDLNKKRADANITAESVQTPDQQPQPSKHEAAEPEKDTVTSKIDGAVQLMDQSSRTYLSGNKEQADAMLQRAKSELEQASTELQIIKNTGAIDESKFKNLQSLINDEMKILDDLTKKRAEANISVKSVQTPDKKPPSASNRITEHEPRNKSAEQRDSLPPSIIKQQELQEQIKSIEDKKKTQSSPAQSILLDGELQKLKNQLKQLEQRTQSNARYKNHRNTHKSAGNAQVSSAAAEKIDESVKMENDNAESRSRVRRP